MILLTIMSPLFMLPLVGLGIDGGRGYIVQSKLSAAVDGAALGAGRLIGTNANIQEIAGEFLHVNFPQGYWGTVNYNENITYVRNNGTDTITVTASADLPLTFIRLLGLNLAHVSATGVVTRKVTRVVLVLDRSGSMDHNDPVTGQNVFQAMKTGSLWFASHFTPGYDEVGLVVYNGSAIVGYPTTRPYDSSPTSNGGPDKQFATDAQNQIGPIFDSLRTMDVGGGTGTVEGLSLAFIELQKAHNRDLAANGVDNVQNTIVLFTDGVPNALAVYANDPANNSLQLPAQTACVNNPATANQPATQMKGYMVPPGSPPGPSVSFPGWGYPSNQVYGLVDLAAYDNNHTLNWWLGSGGASDLSKMVPTSAVNGCVYLNASTPRVDDLAKVPTSDIYGNNTTGLAYNNSLLDDGVHAPYHPNTGAANFNDPAGKILAGYTASNHKYTGYNIAAGAWNACDDAANRIRSQTAMNPIQIFTIGYTGNGGVDTALLNAISNTPQSYRYDSTQPPGKFYKVTTTTALTDAFNAVASQVMRLAQ